MFFFLSAFSIKVLKRLPLHLKMKLKVSEEYIDGFHQANNTFLYQLAFDPMTRRLVPLHPYSDDIDKESLTYAGAYPFLNVLWLTYSKETC